ncbi:MAG: flagellar biosynthetic protein FliO [Betaproteobacteria bacterium]|jgi:flagellar protein FliO/FliZ|nr:flagellar biosynthetic protein FliO [Betaproteobacteria bacterium]NBY52159.1 flagellar biosynthetic protein FliO [Betaproteobacteria bacterium]NCA23245.1 flagellar biosynthetic protein FliO [Betaproteobacteria bacterium]NCU85610.1 flagellar biosynthetic protein FliO [Betaproteobacteria bacterium]
MNPPPDTGSAMLQMVLSLLLVLALVVGSLTLLRRLRPGGLHSGATLRVVASTAVGPRESVVVVELGDEWLVLGVAPGAVRLLQSRPRGTTPATTPEPPPQAFAARLLEALRQRS